MKKAAVVFAMTFLLIACSQSPALPATSTPITSPVDFLWSITGDPKPFSVPVGIAVDKDGNLYVMDSGNSQIQKFDSEGNFLLAWGSKGAGDGQFFINSHGARAIAS